MKGHLIAPRGARRKPACKRIHSTYELTLRDKDTGDHRAIKVGIGTEHGDIVEVWIDVAKVGSDLRTSFEAWVMLASLAMQHGMPVGKLAQSVSGIKTGRYKIIDGPAGIEGKSVTSILSAVGLVLSEASSG